MTENTTSCTEATDESSRRSFLKAGALASGGLALGLSGGSGVAAGHGDENADGKNSLNLADVTFLQMMAYHHRGAVELAGLASERTDREELLEFAEMAIEAQSDEIEQIRTMLRDAGINPGEVLDVDLDTVRGLVSNIPGMFKANELAHLRSLEGTEFDLTFIDIFTYHHRGAIILSKEVLTHGQSPGVEQLANGIIDAQKKPNNTDVSLVSRLGIERSPRWRPLADAYSGRRGARSGDNYRRRPRRPSTVTE